MRTNFLLTILLLIALILPGTTQTKSAIPDAARLHLLIKKLAVVGNALYVGAHPDDENTAVLATLSLGRLLRTGYLALNRGEGGQNLIGTEQGDLLGIIRTQELLAARKIDNAEQFFTRAVDFGYSKSAEESLRFWGKEETLADVVWVFRRFRPDVVITRFPTEGETHGHHLSSAILAQEAYAAAADPNRFPEQLKYVSTWKPKRLVWNRYSRGSQTIPEDEKATLAALEVGEYNSLLGKSYTEIAGISRSMHKSQGFGDSQDRGAFTQHFRHTAGDPAKGDLLEGVDLTWNRIPGGGDIGKILERVANDFDSTRPEQSIPGLLNAYGLMLKIKNNPWVEEKKMDLLEVVRGCSGLWLEAISAQTSAAPGSDIQIDLTAVNRSSYAFRLESVRLIGDKNGLGPVPERSIGKPLPYNQPVSEKLTVSIPLDAPYSQPYWLQNDSSKPFANVADPLLIGQPESPNALRAEFVLSAGQHRLIYSEPVLFREVDPIEGEVYQDFVVVPEIGISVQDPVVVFPDTTPKEIRVQLTSGNSAKGDVRLILPPGWSSEPASYPVNFTSKDETRIIRFMVRPQNGAVTGEFKAEATIGSRKISTGKIVIDYPHIPAQTLFPPAGGRLIRVNLQTAGRNIAYIEGPGDAIPEALTQIGYAVTPLSDEDLLTKDLTSYDAILVGIRAYNTRPVLKDARERLLKYVEQGGTLVVQYQTSQDLVTSQLGPYPFQISRRRVSVETAPVAILQPEHVLLNKPNKITQADFEGWIQERGLYFPDSWDPQYQTILSSADPNEDPLAGGLLYAQYGKGAYIFTSYSWFRQLPAGVPGAYRLFVNLISSGKSAS